MALETAQVLYTVGGLAFAFASGYAFGNSVPSWQEDYYNDHHPSEMPSGLMAWGMRGYYEASCLFGWLNSVVRLGKAGALVFAVAALILVYGYSGLGSDEGLGERGGGFLLLFDVRTWLLLGAAGVGYVVGIVTDKGPVGPLQ